MPRAKVPHIRTCSICGKPIFQIERIGKGYCKECKDLVLKTWNNVPFYERVRYLEEKGIINGGF